MGKVMDTPLHVDQQQGGVSLETSDHVGASICDHAP
jgi:hypothetical protein